MSFFLFLFTDSITSLGEIPQSIPDSSLYDEVLNVDNQRVTANTSALVQYIQLVTILIQQYLLSHKTLRPFFVPVVPLQEVSCTCLSKTFQDQSSSTCCDNSSGDRCSKEQRNHTVASVENENIGDNMRTSNCRESDGALNQASFSHSTATHSRSFSEINYQGFDKQEKNLVKKDVKVLNDFQVYLGLFEHHIKLICKPDDIEAIQTELQFLKMLLL